MLKIDNAVKIFSQGTPNEHKALNSLSLNLKRGEFVTIVGSNGAGKSTMFNAICGNFLLDSGKIEVDGKDITFMKEHKRALLKISFSLFFTAIPRGPLLLLEYASARFSSIVILGAVPFIGS